MSSERSQLVCSVNRALWHEVGPQLRRVLAKLDNRVIFLRFIFDGEPSEEDRESAYCSGTVVLADYPDFELKEEIIRCDAPESIEATGGWLTIYARREN